MLDVRVSHTQTARMWRLPLALGAVYGECPSTRVKIWVEIDEAQTLRRRHRRRRRRVARLCRRAPADRHGRGPLQAIRAGLVSRRGKWIATDALPIHRCKGIGAVSCQLMWNHADLVSGEDGAMAGISRKWHGTFYIVTAAMQGDDREVSGERSRSRLWRTASAS